MEISSYPSKYNSFVYLDSTQRDVAQYPNPADYAAQELAIQTWLWNGRRHCEGDVLAKVSLQMLILPWSQQLAASPLILIDMFTQGSKDGPLVSTLDDDRGVTFVAETVSAQSNSSGTPTWIHYRSPMVQTMRLCKGALIVRLRYQDGTQIVIDDTNPPTPTLQTYMVVEAKVE